MKVLRWFSGLMSWKEWSEVVETCALLLCIRFIGWWTIAAFLAYVIVPTVCGPVMRELYEMWLDHQIAKRYLRIQAELGSVDSLHQLIYRKGLK